MAFAYQGDQHQLNRLTLANNHFFDIGGDPINRLFNILHTAPLIDSLISGIAPRKYTITCGGWGVPLRERSLVSHSYCSALRACERALPLALPATTGGIRAARMRAGSAPRAPRWGASRPQTPC